MNNLVLHLKLNLLSNKNLLFIDSKRLSGRIYKTAKIDKIPMILLK